MHSRLVWMCMTVALGALLAGGCVRFGIGARGDGPDPPGDASPDDSRSDHGPLHDGRSDGSRDAADDRSSPDAPRLDVALDGPALDGPAVDVAPALDGAPPDQPLGDAGAAVPGSWVTIGSGTFTMGSPASEPCRYANEDLHQVTLTRAFEMQVTEVTQGQFNAVMGYNPSSFSSCGSDCPVEKVRWHEAAAYCNALSKMAGKTQCYACSGGGANVSCQETPAHGGQQIYSCPGYRLPTEAEWEHAYRAGATAAYHSGANDGTACSTCSQLDANAGTIAWYCANSGNTPRPVGKKAANDWGLHDMAGNVWEWCHDRYGGSLGTTAVTDPWGAASGTSRVTRGGSWTHNAYALRAAYRSHNFSMTLRYNHLGFRCVRTN